MANIQLQPTMTFNQSLWERLRHYAVKWAEYSVRIIFVLFGIIAAMFVFNGLGDFGRGMNLFIFIVGLFLVFLVRK